MENILTSIYDFEELRRRGGVYVDKTDRILPLVGATADKQYFLSRPRRFGKSLLLSTIKYLFQGRRDLFEGLAIASPAAGWDWEGERCPVLHLDMSMCSGTMGQVEGSALSALRRMSRDVEIPLRAEESTLEGMFSALIEDAAAASPTGQCVVLIDEYDKPLVQHLGTPGAREFQAFLKRFYGVVKATERFQRFCLVAGVSKFSKVSIFSDLNNLVDLTMSPLASALLGYTHQEARANFPEALGALADSLGKDAEGAFAELVEHYDGYCFDGAMERVFNPVSLGMALSTGRIRPYWFETGTPGWLMSYAKANPIEVEDIELDEASLGVFEPDAPNMSVLLFQTGYLTIKETVRAGRGTAYRLGFPNIEVADGFNTWLARAYVDAPMERTSAWQRACREAVAAGDAGAFVEALRSYFAAIGYDLTDRLSEQAYQCVTVAILNFIGIALDAEVTTSRGRIDMACKSAGHVFVVEMKVASGQAATQAAAQEAVAQIRERGYADPYRADAATGARRVQLLGLAFDCDTHNIAAWACEDL